MREVIFFLVCCVVGSLAEENYLALMPREVRPGMDYHIDIIYPSTPDTATTVVAQVLERQNLESSLAWQGSNGSTLIGTDDYTGRITITVPAGLIPATKYYVFLKFNDVPYSGSKEVSVAVTPPLMFVQTDKGIYKPSDTVQLRVLCLDTELKPVSGDELKLRIKDPKDNTVMYQDEFEANKGLVSASFSIPRDPIFGTYMAIAEGKWGTANVTWEVAEYTLPKFEVKVELDRSYVIDPFFYGEANGDVTVTGTVKAVYTYGAYVRGTMTVTVDGIRAETFTNFDGEERFSILVRRNNADEKKKLEVFAEMTEQFTEETANDTKTVSVYDAEYRTLVIKPIPNTVGGESDYKFFVQLTDASGQRITNIEDFRWVVESTLTYKDSSFTTQTLMSRTSSMSVLNSNPVEITLPATTSEGTQAYYSNIEVNFEEIATGRAALSESFTPVEYRSENGQALFINIVDKITGVEMSNTETYELANPEVCFKVRRSGTEALGKVFYQVIGNFYPEGVKPMNNVNRQCVTLTLDNAPKSMIMAYTLLPKDDEYLVASVTVDVQWKSPHQVSLTISPSEQRPNQLVTITVQTEGPAIVGIDGVDKSILYLAEANSITESKVQKRIGDYRIFGKEEDQGTNFPGPMPLFRSFLRPFPAGPKSTSADEKLKDAGLAAMSPMSIYGGTDNRRCPECELALDAPMPGDGGNWGCPECEFAERVPMLGDAGFDMDMAKEDAPTSGQESDTESKQSPQQSTVRTEFPETWLFDIVETDIEGKKDIEHRCPGTITTFVVNAYGLNNLKGLGVAPTSELKCFQPFFVSLNLPYSIVRGENFDLQILVFNYNNEVISVTTSLIKSSQFDVLDGKPSSRVLTIQPGSSQEFTIPVMAKVIGEIDLSVKGVRGSVTDQVVRKLIVKPEGKEIRVSQEQQANVRTGTKSSLKFEYSKFFTEPEEDVVRDSLRMYLQATGDMMGPFIDNLEGNMQMPTGCGEQNMITLIPSVFVAKYLISINRFSADTRQRVAKYCGRGYAKELIYKHSDGSYSAFGEGPGLCGCMFGEGEEDGQKTTFPAKPGSSWLTAFVLYVFSIMADMQLTYVNHDTLGQSYDFLAGTVEANPNTAVSYFKTTGTLYHQDMTGGTADGPAYTAYVLIAMTEYKNFQSNINTEKRRRRDVQESAMIIESAATWLEDRTSLLSTPFQLSIVALALARAGKESKAKVLLQKAETAQMTIEPKCPRYMPWRNCEKDASPRTCSPDTCLSGMLCCESYCGGMECTEGEYGLGPSLVEARGYTVLAYLALSDYQTHLEKIRPHADWLLANRQSGGRFVSTQDTAVALQALAEYASKFKDQAVADFNVLVPISNPVVIAVNSNNYETLQQKPLNIQWMDNMASRNLSVDVTGTSGTAFVTLLAYYNSKNDKAVSRSIDLTVEATTMVNSTVTHIKTCFQPKEPVLETDIVFGNMDVVEISLQSGMKYAKDKVDLRALEEAGVTKVEEEQGKVTLYFEATDNEKYIQRCTYLPVTPEFDVRNRAVGSVKVYDYYQATETMQEAFYATEICETDCGPLTTKSPTIGAASIYIHGVLLVAALVITLALFRMD